MSKQKSQIKIHRVDTWDSRFISGVSPHVLRLKKNTEHTDTFADFYSKKKKRSSDDFLFLNKKNQRTKKWKFSLNIFHWKKPQWEYVSLATMATFMFVAFILIAPLHVFSFFEETKKTEVERFSLLAQYVADINKGIPRQKEIAELYKTSSDEISKWLPLITKIPWIEDTHQIFFENLAKNFPQLSLMGEFFLHILTDPTEKNYLIFFQNNQEIRPTGGFLGSFLFVSIKNGKIERMELPSGGTYDLNGQLKHLIFSPEPLRVINARWECQDMNWFFDFPTSAKKMKECYEEARGETIDGVLVFNASLLPPFISLLGDIEDPSTGKILTSENILSFLTARIEIESYARSEAPKQVLQDLLPRIIERVHAFSFQEYQGVLKLFFDGLMRREIQMYVEDASFQKLITQLGWSGTMLRTEGDYLAVVHSNIGGEKTDGVIHEDIVETTLIEEDGTIVDTVNITRSHRGQLGDLFTGVVNTDYVRVYVPFGSTFLSGTGFDSEPLFEENRDTYLYVKDKDISHIESSSWIDPESGTKIYDELGKTVFANWMILEPGETKTTTLRYRLPYKLPFVSMEKDFISRIFHPEKDDLLPYNFYLQRQSGMEQQTFRKEIEYPAQKFILKTSDPMPPIFSTQGKATFDLGPFTKDLYSFIIFSLSYGRRE